MYPNINNYTEEYGCQYGLCRSAGKFLYTALSATASEKETMIMNNKDKVMQEEHNIKFSEGKVEIVYTNPGAGCLVSSALFGTMLSAFVLFVVVSDSGFVRGFLGIIIGMTGLIFTCSILLKLISVILSGKTLITIESGLMKGRKGSVPINEITEIKWGGSSLKYLVAQTTDKKKIKFPTYNLVGEEKVNQVIKEYVVPYATPELKWNWEKSMGDKEA